MQTNLISQSDENVRMLNKPRTISERLAEAAKSTFVGRKNVFTVIAGREPPNPAWLTTPGWSELFREIKLGELSKEDTIKMLESRGLRPDQIERVMRFAKGFPLALEMAAAAINTQPHLEIADGPPPKVLQQLTDAFLAGLPTVIIEAVEASSTMRRIPESAPVW